METGTSRTKLDPDGEERFVSLRRALGVTSFGINQLVLEPRQRGRIHRHERQEEVYLVLEGTLTLVVEGEEQAVERGELVRVAPEVRRQLVNRGPERLVMVALGGDGRARRPRRPGVHLLGRRAGRAAAGDPAARRPARSSRAVRRAGGWCSPKGEPWSSRQSLKRPWRAWDSSSPSTSTSSTTPPSSRTRSIAASMSSTAKKT